MTTDNFPQTYIYLSRRIINDLYDQHEAHSRGMEVNVTAKIPGIDLKASGRKQVDNYYWLARQVTEAVRDNTGTLLDPGTYVRARMEVTWAEVPFLEGGFRVAWMSCFADTKEGPAFAALCGSLQNFVGYSEGEDHRYRGWYPSAPVGMAKLVSSFSGDREDVSGAALWASDSDPEQAIRSALTISSTLGSGHIAGRAELDVLFQVFSWREYPIGQGSGRVAMIGTPIWAATCAPIPGLKPAYTRQLPEPDADDSPQVIDAARTGALRRFAQRFMRPS
ncbi:hypothetical protein QLQ12_46440 [Actinoplanes sp. NEAU-A12]|uniref:Uncharacterized protein n=1 Tax=Actinoplanes sandaracinus TaxID=3045177 RepID=A0ABT6X207_9ACTN|nr:hypothetical protein [Actinoplanes sandaracinus]MDI6106029.1 hypothetical protein [Actinoplanes sandaracinus]